MKTIPSQPVRIIQCGCCDHWHRANYFGDCRNDAERFDDMEDAANRLGKPVIEVLENGDYCDVAVEPAVNQ